MKQKKYSRNILVQFKQVRLIQFRVKHSLLFQCEHFNKIPLTSSLRTVNDRFKLIPLNLQTVEMSHFQVHFSTVALKSSNAPPGTVGSRHGKSAAIFKRKQILRPLFLHKSNKRANIIVCSARIDQKPCVCSNARHRYRVQTAVLTFQALLLQRSEGQVRCPLTFGTEGQSSGNS